MLMLLGIGDFGRLYTNTIAVEAATREAADYGAFAASQWSTAANVTLTQNEMLDRACTAVSGLPDYTTGDGSASCASPGANPVFSYVLEDSTGNPIANPPANCGDPNTSPPCVVHVTLAYTYHTFFSVPDLPLLGFSPYPSTIVIRRDSRFAVSNISAP